MSTPNNEQELTKLETRAKTLKMTRSKISSDLLTANLFEKKTLESLLDEKTKEYFNVVA